MSAIKATKRPIEIEAMQYDGLNAAEVVDWIDSFDREAGGSVVAYGLGVDGTQPILRIQTLEGDMIVSIGDYVIRGVAGEFYPCKPDIWDKTYIAGNDYAEVYRADNGEWAWRRRDGGNYKVLGWTGETHQTASYAVEAAIKNSGVARVVLIHDGEPVEWSINGSWVSKERFDA